MALYGYVEGRSDGLGIADKVILKCECIDECEIEVNKYTDEIVTGNKDGRTLTMNDYSIVFKTKNRNNILNVSEAFMTKLRKIWHVIKGKDYMYYDVCLDEKAMKKFIESLQNLVDGKNRIG